MKLSKLKKVMAEREKAEKLVYVISEMMAKRPTAKNIKKATDYLEGRFDMGSDIDDALLLKIEEKLKGNLPFLRKTKKNPAEREIGSLPEQGKYTSFNKWAAAVKKIGGRLRSSPSTVPQIVYGPFGFISEWNGRSGKIEEFFDPNPVRRKNPVRQRIAVSLSRSQVRRNPFNDRNLDA